MELVGRPESEGEGSLGLGGEAVRILLLVDLYGNYKSIRRTDVGRVLRLYGRHSGYVCDPDELRL